jgi:hypothetical protein
VNQLDPDARLLPERKKNVGLDQQRVNEIELNTTCNGVLPDVTSLAFAFGLQIIM